ncbi:MAG TPA: hypothetical protein VF661_04230 [Actinomycetales bacterium]|jgi:hypothetical protein
MTAAPLTSAPLSPAPAQRGELDASRGRLEAVPDRPLTTADLAVVVRRVAGEPRLWRPAVRVDGSATWTRLSGPAGVQVWMRTWLRAQGTGLHDHAEAASAFAVVLGTVVETRVDPVLGTWSTPLDAPAVRVLVPGTVHDVRNDAAAPAVTIHAYTPRASRTTYYEQAADGELVVVRDVRADQPLVGS